MHSENPPLVMTFGASDPTGATGIQADLATFSSFGCHGFSALTCLTVQDTVQREAALHIDPEWVIDQARQVLEDVTVLAFKVGDVGTSENVTAIAEVVADYPDVGLVLAPELDDNPDNQLAEEEKRVAIAELLIPQASLLVLRQDQFEDLANIYFEDEQADFHACLGRLLDIGCEYVLLTDGEQQSWKVTHSLYGLGEGAVPTLIRRDSWDRLPQTFYGKNDTLSAAITALMANGLDIPEAVGEAQEYLHQALLAGFRLGMGRFMPDRLFWTRDEDDDDASDPAVSTKVH